MSHRDFIRPGLAANLAHLVEECGEVLAAAGKTQRFGPLSSNPLLAPEHRELNAQWLFREMCDLEDALDRARQALIAEHGDVLRPAPSRMEAK